MQELRKMTDKEAMKLALEALHGSIPHLPLNDEAQSGRYIKALTAIEEALAQPEQEPVMILPDGSAFGVMSLPLPDDHWLYAPNEYRDGEYEPIDLPKPILTHALRDAVVAAVRYAVRGATMRGQETDFDPDALVQNAVYALCGPYTTPPAQLPQRTEQEPVPAYLDDWAVDRFAAAMKAKMAKQREKGYSGWDDPEQCPTERLQTMLFEHIAKGDPVDVGNFAMMLWNRVEATTPPAQPAQRKPLTDDEMKLLWAKHGYRSAMCKPFARAIEAAHGIKEIEK
jgi:hypothetical protein